MADRNFSSNLVLSVFPAPLSPLLRKNMHFIHKSRTGRANDHPTRGREVISRNKHVASPLWQAGIRQRVGRMVRIFRQMSLQMEQQEQGM